MELYKETGYIIIVTYTNNFRLQRYVARLVYRGHTFYWNDATYPETKKGVTCGSTGLMFVETEATTLHDVGYRLQAVADMRWKTYQKLLITKMLFYQQAIQIPLFLL